MKASLDKLNCIFCGMCGGICSDVFRADFDGKSVAMDKELSGELLASAKYAEAVCPTWAITIGNSPVVGNLTI